MMTVQECEELIQQLREALLGVASVRMCWLPPGGVPGIELTISNPQKARDLLRGLKLLAATAAPGAVS